jgi:hypothetical protein
LGARVRELGAIAVAIQKFPMEDVAGSRLMLRVLGRFDGSANTPPRAASRESEGAKLGLLFSAIPPAFVLQRFQKCPETPAAGTPRGRRLYWSGFGEASCVPASWTASAGYSALFVTSRSPPTAATTRLPSIGIVITLERRPALLAEAASPPVRFDG